MLGWAVAGRRPLGRPMLRYSRRIMLAPWSATAYVVACVIDGAFMGLFRHRFVDLTIFRLSGDIFLILLAVLISFMGVGIISTAARNSFYRVSVVAQLACMVCGCILLTWGPLWLATRYVRQADVHIRSVLYVTYGVTVAAFIVAITILGRWRLRRWPYTMAFVIFGLDNRLSLEQYGPSTRGHRVTDLAFQFYL